MRNFVAICILAALGPAASAQKPNSWPNPYRAVENWAQVPDTIHWGQVIGANPDAAGNLWVFHRAEPPLMQFDASGKLLQTLGQGMFVNPHGLHIDREGNIWVSDSGGRGGKGHQVFKFSPAGKILLTLGTAGAAGEAPDKFNGPADIVTAPNGDIFIADGHVNNRVVKFSKDGTFIKAWGKKGSAPGEFDVPHTIAMDSRGRLFVGDRNNSRIQIFDQDGKYLEEWKQFSRPSGIYITADDRMFVADSDSNAKTNPGWLRGIRIGSAKTGAVAQFIPDTEAWPDSDARWYEPNGPRKSITTGPEDVSVDAQGNVYGAEVGPRRLMRYVPVK